MLRLSLAFVFSALLVVSVQSSRPLLIRDVPEQVGWGSLDVASFTRHFARHFEEGSTKSNLRVFVCAYS
jgi:hypothetical protein